ncbi:hypothetical protein P2318_33905 [Myxococcaceae bacterium GXIMD 01537]
MEHSVERLSLFLREEMTAVDAYQRVLGSVRHPKAREGLAACFEEHKERVEALESFIEAHGVTPKEAPDRRGFGRLQGVNASLPDRGLVEVLEEGEEFELQDYEKVVEKLSGEDRRFVEERLLPSQRATVERLRSIRELLH